MDPSPIDGQQGASSHANQPQQSRYKFSQSFWQNSQANKETVKDTFVGSGQLATTQGPVKIFINKTGQLFRKHLKKFFNVGNMDGSGNFIFQSGYRGNVFHDRYFNIQGSSVRGAIGDQLRTTQRNEAQASSEISLIRQHLTQYGITGQGIKIGLMERGVMDKEGNLEAHEHTRAVAAVINDPQWGIAPEATIQMLPFPKEKPRPEPKDSQAFLDKALNQAFTELLGKITQSFEEISNTAPPELRIINMSYGMNLTEILRPFSFLLKDRDELGQFKYPKLRKVILGSYENSTDPKVVNKQILDYLNRYMQNSIEFQNKLKRYQKATKALADRGIFIVISTGNEHNGVEGLTHVPALAEFNFLTMSDHVIRAAWADNNGTPQTTADDFINMHSSHGDGKRWNPTIAGREWWIDRYYQNTNGLFQGTSSAAPTISATIALMLQRNPALTFDQVVYKLQSTATNTAEEFKAEGAGMLNIISAVLS